ncbi:MAG: chemotaxis protein CheW [Clostridium sp.]|jgi:purine-binding chemotaxis protein CheW|uniref:chemotaxis protein CheW n=1 Tax=Clostridium TaxID=1485 RepID=UPI001C1DD0D1|nr:MULTISPECIES: chemotaxis protein CheW [Clostridium]MBS5885194.1 chemotaxis protein CheW [Clostridium sp.]MBS6502001.1 chemotaxis protein CheW [Clostridium sp.]MBU6135939.1 chemotaxis protein CheW [Clostridium tertium]MDU3548222.1 chemotaxis protein CheW [Clostridium sp.]MDU6364900.1 chemotaxis protein CheW [Clostridium sp.]
MQFVIFKLGEEHFAVETDKILSINDMMTITRVPKAPDYIKGLINLRGSIKSLVDVNLLLNIESKKEQNNIIILKVDEEEIGISVDEVEEVIDIDEDKLQRLETHNTEAYIKGVIELEEKLLTVIDIEKLLNY